MTDVLVISKDETTVLELVIPSPVPTSMADIAGLDISGASDGALLTYNQERAVFEAGTRQRNQLIDGGNF
ncbi:MULTISPECIES: hypothetical protein [Azospirillaceae]|uniref:hypothetical protein n=1 Tax=Azospirillaceae TaxID=2829815 RepID=UPI000B67D889|nr:MULTISPECIES: hypothetical protein [Azospirillaceae]MDG5496962.1 hypothetical protein [Niveispirillum sp. BGYR6]SNS83591.1 hypothetical protein SAMN05880556_11316 [Azospirillum sp. RU38E]SNT00749.1 hypothetical protein SAMN05880591_11315 [Azospirillum sp. RU37A]